ncbi:MAG TPA: EAL domain-containing protein [Rhizomicrobium sp.]|jgi:cyclic-di-GMP phosphodiesterase TipF (flagellum assembly factor)
MTNALITTIYILLSATAALALNVLGFASPATAALLGAVGLLFALQVHAGVIRRRDRTQSRREIAKLKQTTREIAVALEETHAKIDEAKVAAEARTSAQGRKIVAELQVLESLMKDFAGKIAQNAQQQASSEGISLRANDVARSYLDTLGESELLETIRASLEENRVDLYLQPIVSLPQRKLRFYEALSRLRAEDGTVIMPAQYMKIAAPAGLMSVVDNLLLFRCVQIVRKLASKHREVGVFCNISSDTLTDAEFFPQFLEYMHQNRDLAPHIVFEFAQGALAKAGNKGTENLAYLASLGFALSLDHVETLAIDFAYLKKLGFRHVKVRASMLTSGMSGTGALVAAEDLKTLLERHGLNLIAERVEDERTVVQLLDYAVDFAQGYLFGEPRAARDDSVKPGEQGEPSAPVIAFKRSA